LRVAYFLRTNGHPPRDFSGKQGKPVLLGIATTGAAAANILSTNYNGVTQSTEPFRITLGQGDHGLVVVLIASIEGTQVSIHEIDMADPTNTQVLAKSFFRKSDPSAVILVRVP
jgi:hypothetical protein